MNTLFRFAMTAAAMALLAACGAKGPLFMPEKPAAGEEVPAEPVTHASATTEPAAEADPSSTQTATDTPTEAPVTPPDGTP